MWIWSFDFSSSGCWTGNIKLPASISVSHSFCSEPRRQISVRCIVGACECARARVGICSCACVWGGCPLKDICEMMCMGIHARVFFCYFGRLIFIMLFFFFNKQDYNHLFYLYGVFQRIQTEKYIKNSNKNVRISQHYRLKAALMSDVKEIRSEFSQMRLRAR